MVAIGGLRHNGKLLPGDDMKTVKHTNTIVYYDGVRVFAGQDAVGDHYVGAMIDTAGDADRYLADRYLVVAVAADPRRRFYAGELARTAVGPGNPTSYITASSPTGTGKPWNWRPTIAATPKSKMPFETSSTASDSTISPRAASPPMLPGWPSR